MRDLTLLSKLLAEEDIHVIHRKQSTAMFDVLNRELSLPIWKDMSKNVQELMNLAPIKRMYASNTLNLSKIEPSPVDE